MVECLRRVDALEMAAQDKKFMVKESSILQEIGASVSAAGMGH